MADPETQADITPTTSVDTPPKRTRVLLSCAPCRNSKLKCDRATPCGQCLKKGRTDLCVYAPKPVKNKPPQSMAARLKRLEGMVRGMIDPELEGVAARPAATEADEVLRGQVIQGEGGRGATYVGATHFMAILDDIEDLKSYFDETAQPEEDESPEKTPEADSPELFMMSRAQPRSRQDLINLLPPKNIADRLVMRYYSSHAPSMHIVHKTTFVKTYNEFWQDPSAVSLDWLALFFMVLALGVFFSSYSAPHEVESDSSLSAMERFKKYREAAGWALVSGKYTSPRPTTCAPFLLYVEAEFLINRASQMNCYLLSSVCIRIMLKMGLHRDPSKLANLTPFDGEMRRRVWNLAIQIDLMVSFHMGLPSMIHGIESDTTPPRNLIDSDFDENSTELPPGRPPTEYTEMTYPIYKSAICRVFGLVARQAHSLNTPIYSEVMRLDGLLQEKWNNVPSFMKVRPLEQCVTDPPHQVIQRFGIAALYQKSRCVLHRRYLLERFPKREHEYSRKACVQAALALMEYQSAIWHGTQPGGILSANGWFMTSLAMHDFLLAAMIVYLAIMSDTYSEVGGNYDWALQDTPLPNKDELTDQLRRSYRIWSIAAKETPEVKKAPEVLETMLKKILLRSQSNTTERTSAIGETPSHVLSSRTDVAPVANLRVSEPEIANLSLDPTPQNPPMPFSRNDLVPNDVIMEGLQGSWIPGTNDNVDWDSLDTALRTDGTADATLTDQWMGDSSFNDLDLMSNYYWTQPPEQ